ncbi:hypothetical protein D9758_006669 [Tetrapyrgos nigripes]|uniref:Uncharacterized protein n=1 Tax=Tetrapyrgos nigripes TaxID=182062 RepID=A0A8H5LQL9_9AGAR|nr:hypothetical protein D9758_006669 [Tetrapyrgos nigripes]
MVHNFALKATIALIALSLSSSTMAAPGVLPTTTSIPPTTNVPPTTSVPTIEVPTTSTRVPPHY